MKTSVKIFWLSMLVVSPSFFSDIPKVNAASMENIEILGVVDDGFDYNEYEEIKGFLNRFGCKFTLAGLETEVAGFYGEGKVKKVNTSVLIPNVNLTDYDCIFIPGGSSPNNLIKHQEVLSLVKTAYSSGIVLAAICHGPLVLAEANVINGSEITGNIEIKDTIESAGGIYKYTDVWIDGKIITGNWPHFWKLSIAIAEVLGYYETNLPTIGDFEVKMENSTSGVNFSISVKVSDDSGIFKVGIVIYNLSDDGERLDLFPDCYITLKTSSENVYIGGTSLESGHYCCDIEIEDVFGNTLTVSKASVFSTPVDTMSTPFMTFRILSLGLIMLIIWKRKS
ncbi:MAG: DJ-1/PfpI family protein [Candidatus Hodarchaeales archaeon]|jgi:protease I